MKVTIPRKQTRRGMAVLGIPFSVAVQSLIVIQTKNQMGKATAVTLQIDQEQARIYPKSLFRDRGLCRHPRQPLLLTQHPSYPYHALYPLHSFVRKTKLHRHSYQRMALLGDLASAALIFRVLVCTLPLEVNPSGGAMSTDTPVLRHLPMFA